MSELGAEVKSYSKDLQFEPVPLIDIAWEKIKELGLKPLNSFEGEDLTEVNKRIETPLMTVDMRHYHTKKWEKVSLGWYYYMGPRLTQTVVICPSDDYDLPVFMSDIDERKKGSSMIVDLWPTLDIGAEEWYREKYYDGVASIYAKYWDLGPQQIIFHPDLSWWRSFSSPYELNIELPLDQRGTLIKLFTEYIEYYANLYKKAEPVNDPKLRERIVKKKQVQRKWFREKDPAKGVMIRAVGAAMEKKIMLALL